MRTAVCAAAPRVRTFKDHWLQIGTGCIYCCRVACRAAADDDQVLHICSAPSMREVSIDDMCQIGCMPLADSVASSVQVPHLHHLLCGFVELLLSLRVCDCGCCAKGCLHTAEIAESCSSHLTGFVARAPALSCRRTVAGCQGLCCGCCSRLPWGCTSLPALGLHVLATVGQVSHAAARPSHARPHHWRDLDCLLRVKLCCVSKSVS